MKICKCTCHRKGSLELHQQPCCEYTYEKYINTDGTVDIEKYNKLNKTL